jgi:hypothetical protein
MRAYISTKHNTICLEELFEQSEYHPYNGQIRASHLIKLGEKMYIVTIDWDDKKIIIKHDKSNETHMNLVVVFINGDKDTSWNQ